MSTESEIERLRRRLEQLESRYASLRLLVENMPIGLFAMEDPRSGRLSQVNPAFARMFGHASPAECEAWNAYATYTDPKERDETFARFLADERFRQTGIAKFETVRLRKDGTPLPVLITVSATFREDGSIARFDGAMEDLSERRSAERTFMASEERFRVVFETVDIGVALTDREGKIARANPALARFLGREEGELVGVAFDDLLDEADRERPVVGRPGDGADELRMYAAERRFATASGETAIGYAAVTWLTDGDGRPVQAAVVVQDVTVRRRLEDELARVQRLESLSLLAGGIAHDFNNFLAAILGNISLARARRSDVLDCLAAAEDAAVRARDVTRQLLTFASGGAPVKRPSSLVEVARESAAFCLRGSAVACVFHEADDVPLVELDAGQMAQVFSNLFLNAAEAMPDGGQIDVETDAVDLGRGSSLPLAEGRYVRASVIDRGTGIPPQILARVFDPYFTTKGRGSGLGLASVHSIVKRHGGHVEVRSELGRGTVFTLYLPACTQRETPVSSSVPPALAPLRARVLAMDDEPAVRELLDRMLTGLGCEVQAVADGEAAIEAWKRAREAGRPFDVAILDLTIRGGVGGEETMRRLRAIDPSARAIVSSGYADNPVMAHHRDHGFSGIASKPYTVPELVETLRRALRRSAASESRDG